MLVPGHGQTYKDTYPIMLNHLYGRAVSNTQSHYVNSLIGLTPTWELNEVSFYYCSQTGGSYYCEVWYNVIGD